MIEEMKIFHFSCIIKYGINDILNFTCNCIFVRFEYFIIEY